MTNCIRNGIFGNEKHLCFQCKKEFFPAKQKTCPICNWKICPDGHCGCTVTPETKRKLANFYELFCNPGTIDPAIEVMLDCFINNCYNKTKGVKF